MRADAVERLSLIYLHQLTARHNEFGIAWQHKGEFLLEQMADAFSVSPDYAVRWTILQVCILSLASFTISLRRNCCCTTAACVRASTHLRLIEHIARRCACSFGIWSDAIKKQYNLSQLQVAGIGTAGNVGGYMAIFAGLLYDWLRGMNRYSWSLTSGLFS